ncbi:hydrogenase maturation protease [Dehalogenimonas alkenigignens]|uniref:hydrogenase maturation protease n=1 Tax=Dehalogenimonas alkenigignens TaxID=1217799 RepID=UPI000D570531|nr:hydrogenase maturation protease [Dehalogenimonas alkenigignens]PVV85017.1 hydrogenase maturation protease [Dehalogenimonas alkenigignens]
MSDAALPITDAAALPRILILGVGNILLSDEGAGVEVINKLNQCKLPEYIELVDGATRAMELADIMRGRDKVIIADAVAAGSEPGAVFRFGIDQLAELRQMSVSVHDIGVHEAIFQLRLLGELPPDIVFYGIQPDSLALGEGLTPKVKAAVEIVKEFILQDLAIP